MKSKDKSEARTFGIAFLLLAVIDMCQIAIAILRVDRGAAWDDAQHLAVMAAAYTALVCMIKLRLGIQILCFTSERNYTLEYQKTMIVIRIISVISLVLSIVLTFWSEDLVDSAIEIGNSGLTVLLLFGCLRTENG